MAKYLKILWIFSIVLCKPKEPIVIVVENSCEKYIKKRGLESAFKKIKERLKKTGFLVVEQPSKEKIRIETEIFAHRLYKKDSLKEILGGFKWTKIKNDTIFIKIGIQSINYNADSLVRKVFVLNGAPKPGLARRVTYRLTNYLGLSCLTPEKASKDTFFFTVIYHGKKEKNLAESIKRFLKKGILKQINGLKDIIIIVGKDMLAKKNTKYGILIKKSEFKLYLLKGYDTVKVYSVAIGKNPGDKKRIGDYRTPEGCFYVIKIENSKNWVHDFPDDTLGPIKGAYGPYFIRLYTGADATYSGKTWKGIGIHGTHDPSSIGKRATEGCIRLKNQDLLELINYIIPGMPVWIER